MFDPIRDLPDGAKHGIDALSIAALIASLIDWLPAVASLLTIVWTAIRIWETDTVQILTGRKQLPNLGGGEGEED